MAIQHLPNRAMFLDGAGGRWYGFIIAGIFILSFGITLSNGLTQSAGGSMDLKSRFGSGKHLQLAHGVIGWLEKSTRPKQAVFGGIGGGKTPEVTWEDGCACIGMIPSPPAKALCELLVWGDSKDSTANKAVIERHLASVMFKACQQRGQGEPRGIGLTLKELTAKMARMVFWHELYNLWDWHSVEGQLRYSGIHQLSPKAYSMTWKPYQDLMLNELSALCRLIDEHVIDYRKQLNVETTLMQFGSGEQIA